MSLRAVGLAVLVGLLVTVRVLFARNKALAERIERAEIKVKQQQVKHEVKDDEPEQVEEATRPDGRSRADRINSVFNDRDA